MLKQVGALAVRKTKEGHLEILLVSSRETGRWVIPKGWPSKKLANEMAAAREAKEEAGVTGKISVSSIGAYAYLKTTKCGGRLVEVSVYLLRVSKARKTWPEKSQRARCWFDITTASRKVREPRLKKLIASLPRKYSRLSR